MQDWVNPLRAGSCACSIGPPSRLPYRLVMLFAPSARLMLRLQAALWRSLAAEASTAAPSWLARLQPTPPSAPIFQTSRSLWSSPSGAPAVGLRPLPSMQELQRLTPGGPQPPHHRMLVAQPAQGAGPEGQRPGVAKQRQQSGLAGMPFRTENMPAFVPMLFLFVLVVVPLVCECDFRMMCSTSANSPAARRQQAGPHRFCLVVA